MKAALTILGIFLLVFFVTVLLHAHELASGSYDFIVEYPIPVADSEPLNIIVASPGHVWFTMPNANMIGSLVVTSTSDYLFTTYPVPTENSRPYDLVLSGGLIWFTEEAENNIGRLDPATGTIVEFRIPTADSVPRGIAAAPNGQIWFTERDGNRIGHLDPATGNITDTYKFDRPDGLLEDLGVQSNDEFWFTAPGVNSLVNFRPGEWPDLNRTFYDIPVAYGAPNTVHGAPFGLVIADDGAPWITVPDFNWIGRYSPTTIGYFRWYAIPTADSDPRGITQSTVDGRNAIWFVESGGGKASQLLTNSSGAEIRLWEQPLPSSNSQPNGIAVDSAGRAWITESGSNHIAEWRPPYLHTTYLSLVAKHLDAERATSSDLASFDSARLFSATGLAASQTPDGANSTPGSPGERSLSLANSPSSGKTVEIDSYKWAPEIMSIQTLEPRSYYSYTTYLPLIANRFDSGLGTPLFGIQTYFSGTPGTPYFTLAEQSTTSWLRVPLVWNLIEPEDVSPDLYNWGAFDPFAEVDFSDGIDLIATFVHAPAWAAMYPNGPIDAEAYDDFAEFVGAMVERYDGDGQNDAPGSPVVNHWEFYNEPDANNGDVRPDSSYWGHDGDQYAHMLSVAHTAAKAADSKAQIVFGGIAYDWFEDQGGPFVREFLDQVLLAGGGQYFDVMNFHSYPAFNTYWAPQGPGLLQKTAYIRNKLHEYNVDKPFVITEAGWHSDNPPDLPSSPEIQARYVVELFTQSIAADVDVMIWWTLYDLGGYYYGNGLVTQDAIPKPSYLAFQTIASELRTAHFDRPLSLAETGATEMEAYRFVDNVHRRMIYVAWLDPVETTVVRSLRLAATRVTLRDIYGQDSLVNDGDDGILDGWVTIRVSGQPVYIEKAL